MVITDKKGFGAGKAAIGCCLLGPVGLAGGAIGMNDIQFICRSCGNKWKANILPDGSTYASSAWENNVEEYQPPKGRAMGIGIAVLVVIAFLIVGSAS